MFVFCVISVSAFRERLDVFISCFDNSRPIDCHEHFSAIYWRNTGTAAIFRERFMRQMIELLNVSMTE